jgi:aminoglycoside 6'-N-acetyltransferase
MPAETAAIRFDPVSERHTPLLKRWLAEPHVRAWWGDPDEEIEKILAGRPREQVDGYVVTVEGAPVGYVQSWRASEFEEEPWQRDLPAGIVGIDIFIGEPAATGKGLGPAIVRAFAGRLLAEGAQSLVIDPDRRNARAIRAYQKAGFVPFAEYPEKDGGTCFMKLTADMYESVI